MDQSTPRMMTLSERGKLGAAIRLCKKNGRCIYPICGVFPAQCWTPQELLEYGFKPGDFDPNLGPPCYSVS